MKSRPKTAPRNEAKTVTPATVRPHRLDAVPVTRAYLDGHLVRPAALTLRDGTEVTVRAIAPDDEARMVAFHKTLSDESVHYRYFGMLSLGFRTGHERLARLCLTDLAREIALVADREKNDGEHEILGVGRLIKTPDRNEAEFAILVPDRWQSDGLGTALLKALVAIARKAKVRIFGHILPSNPAMLHVSRDAGFSLRFDATEDEWEAELDLRSKERPPTAGKPAHASSS